MQETKAPLFGHSARIRQMALHERRWLAMRIGRKLLWKDGGIRLDCGVRCCDSWSCSSRFWIYTSSFILPFVSGSERSCAFELK